MMFDLTSDKPVYFHIGSGCAYADDALSAFDRSLLNSGCGNYNLLRVSSIMPAGAIESEVITLPEGSLLSIAYANKVEEETVAAKELSAAIAVGIPEDSTKVGVIMEYSGACSEEEALNRVNRMIQAAMADRNIKTYSVKTASVATATSNKACTSVFAYAAMFQ